MHTAIKNEDNEKRKKSAVGLKYEIDIATVTSAAEMPPMASFLVSSMNKCLHHSTHSSCQHSKDSLAIHTCYRHSIRFVGNMVPDWDFGCYRSRCSDFYAEPPIAFAIVASPDR
jgi:hypothetical protein